MGNEAATAQRAYLGLGGNVPSMAGRPEQTLAAAAERLQALGRIAGRSRLYSTRPVGFAAQPRFVNAVLALDTPLTPLELLRGLMEIERSFGRDRAGAVPNGPRTLDLDILLYGDLEIHEPGLDVPHPRMAERAFVLVPLAELAQLLGDIALSQSVKQWLHQLPRGASADQDVVFPLDSAVWRGGVADPGDGADARQPDGARQPHGRG